MTCRECELLLGDTPYGAAVEQHLDTCPDCRALARDLRENAVALSAMGAEEYVLEHAPVRPPRPGVWIGAAAAAVVLLLALPSLWPRKSAPVAAPPPPLPQVAASLAQVPVLTAAAPVLALARPRKTRPRKPEPVPEPEETMLVKMLTPDPDVVIYWIVEPKEKAE